MTDEKKFEKQTELTPDQDVQKAGADGETPEAVSAEVPAEVSADTTAEAPVEASVETKRSEPPLPQQNNDGAKYAFRWDYTDRESKEEPKERTLRVRPGVFYGLMVGLIFSVAFGILLIVLLVGEHRAFSGGTVSGNVERVVYVNGSGDAEEELAVEAAVAKMLPSSVSIVVTTKTGTGVGSGVVLSADGYIATNHHVIDGKESVTVQLYGGDRYPATVIGSDEVADLALLKIDAKGLTPAMFGDSDGLLPGQTVMAIGAPTGVMYSESVSRGVISCRTRALKVYKSNGTLQHTLLMVQTDASLNPGNSGGPLFNRKGEVIGIISHKSVFYENGVTHYADGMGLAVPSNAALRILEQIKNGSEIDRTGFLIEAGRLGISGQNVEKGTEFSATGVLVTGFSGTSFDAVTKLRKNDIIVEIDGVGVSTIVEALTVLEDYGAGAAVTLKVYRNGTPIMVELVLGSDMMVE